MSVNLGDIAPDFELTDQTRSPIRLSDYRGKKNVMLVFYPLSFTGVCTGEMCAIRDDLPAFRNDDVETLAVSVDSSAVHAAFATQEGLDFPLLADFWPHGAVARLYGVFNDERGLAVHGTFAIDKDGVVRYTDINAIPDARDPNAGKDALAAL
ncbi:MAG: peroxiredoxin [Nitriliruptoraceae bacterium]